MMHAQVGRPLADVAGLFKSWRGKIAGDGFHLNDVSQEIRAQSFLA